jgi:CubicO group peptidase (beta-lactamase class C family)
MSRPRGIATVAVTLILMLAGCTTSTAEPTGIVTGLAFACSGLPPFVTGRQEVRVRLYSGSRRVASETVVSGARYRFSVSPGLYRVTGWWGSRIVAARAGRTVTVNFMNYCK